MQLQIILFGNMQFAVYSDKIYLLFANDEMIEIEFVFIIISKMLELAY